MYKAGELFERQYGGNHTLYTHSCKAVIGAASLLQFSTRQFLHYDFERKGTVCAKAKTGGETGRRRLRGLDSRQGPIRAYHTMHGGMACSWSARERHILQPPEPAMEYALWEYGQGRSWTARVSTSRTFIYYAPVTTVCRVT